jgi:hypothetical protein
MVRCDELPALPALPAGDPLPNRPADDQVLPALPGARAARDLAVRLAVERVRAPRCRAGAAGWPRRHRAFGSSRTLDPADPAFTVTSPPPIDPPSDRHRAAVARTLQWADGCAARGEYADGLGWLAMIESLGDSLSPEYETKRRRWTAALAARRTR